MIMMRMVVTRTTMYSLIGGWCRPHDVTQVKHCSPCRFYNQHSISIASAERSLCSRPPRVGSCLFKQTTTPPQTLGEGVDQRRKGKGGNIFLCWSLSCFLLSLHSCQPLKSSLALEPSPWEEAWPWRFLPQPPGEIWRLRKWCPGRGCCPRNHSHMQARLWSAHSLLGEIRIFTPTVTQEVTMGVTPEPLYSTAGEPTALRAIVHRSNISISSLIWKPRRGRMSSVIRLLELNPSPTIC